MPKADHDYKITQCLIDRLMEADPKITPERQLKASLRRDLESLLNPRRVVEPQGRRSPYKPFFRGRGARTPACSVGTRADAVRPYAEG
jgi:hypothetical protein